MTADLVGWLRAQLDEDEAKARDAGGQWHFAILRGSPSVVAAEYVAVEEYDRDWPAVVASSVSSDDAQRMMHIAAWDPARVLVEVEAKRRIVDSFAASQEPLTARTAEKAVVRMVLKLMALPYADRPGYRDQWRP